MRYSKLIPVVSALLLTGALTAQQKNFPLNRQFMLETEATALNDSSLHLHTAMRPLIETTHFAYADYMAYNRGYSDCTCKNDTAKSFGKKTGAWFCRKHQYESFIRVKHAGENEWFNLGIDPLMYLEYGKYRGDDTSALSAVLKNTRGIRAYGDIGSKFSFETSFWENQATYANYISDFNDYYKVVPGQGRWKRFKQDGYDFAMASGYVSYSPCKYFNVQAGHGKHFVGDGYRSLLLSDNGFNYPYARLTTTFLKYFQYTNIYASLMNLVPGGNHIPTGTERLFQKKAAAFHQLDVQLFKKRRLDIGLFQGLIWEAADSNNVQHLNFNYFNPVMFTSLPAYGLNTRRNCLIGATWKWRFMRSFDVYGQFMMDEKGEKRKTESLHNKTGMQVGLKYFNAFGIRHLHLQFEYNRVRPYAYANKDTLQNWSHYNQPLAHPLGANFEEYVGFLNYKFRDFYAELRYSTATVGADSSGRNFGSNIFASDNNAFYGVNSTVNVLGQGEATTIVHEDFRIGYMLAYVSNLNVFVGYSNRVFTNSAGKTEAPYIYFGLRTNLNNLYFDF